MSKCGRSGEAVSQKLGHGGKLELCQKGTMPFRKKLNSPTEIQDKTQQIHSEPMRDETFLVVVHVSITQTTET